MTDTLTTDSLKRIFKYPFQEPGWQGRFLVGSVLILAGFFVPILPGIFVAGYILQVMRQVIAGQEPSLPPWDDWGKLAVDGLQAMVTGFVYFLPAMIVMFGGMGFYFFGTFFPTFVVAGASDPTQMVGSMLAITFGSMAILFLSMGLGMLLMLVGAVATPMATAHFVASDHLGAAFRLREWWRILRANKLGYFIAWVVVFGLYTVLNFGTMLLYYTVVLCCLMPIVAAPVLFYVGLVATALFGQTYREGVALVPDKDTAFPDAGAPPEDAASLEAAASLDAGEEPQATAEEES